MNKITFTLAIFLFFKKLFMKQTILNKLNYKKIYYTNIKTVKFYTN